MGVGVTFQITVVLCPLPWAAAHTLAPGPQQGPAPRAVSAVGPSVPQAPAPRSQWGWVLGEVTMFGVTRLCSGQDSGGRGGASVGAQAAGRWG